MGEGLVGGVVAPRGFCVGVGAGGSAVGPAVGPEVGPGSGAGWGLEDVGVGEPLGEAEGEVTVEDGVGVTVADDVPDRVGVTGSPVGSGPGVPMTHGTTIAPATRNGRPARTARFHTGVTAACRPPSPLGGAVIITTRKLTTAASARTTTTKASTTATRSAVGW